MIANLVVAFWSASYDSTGGYLVGVVDYVRYVRDVKTGLMKRGQPLLSNVHFDPIALLDDLLRLPAVEGGPPGAHVVVHWGDKKDIKHLVEAALPSLSAAYFEDPKPEHIAVWATVLAEAEQAAVPIVILGDRGTQRLVCDDPDGYEVWRLGRARWLDRARHFSTVRNPALGLQTRASVEMRLVTKSWSPLEWLRETIDHHAPCSLDDLREGLELEAYEAEESDEDLWVAGCAFEVIENRRHVLAVLAELLHSAMFSVNSTINTNRLARTSRAAGSRRPVPTRSTLYVNNEPKAKWRYRIPSGGWEEALRHTARMAGCLPAEDA